MTTKKQREYSAALAAALEAAHDIGRDLHRQDPELLLVAVARKASAEYPNSKALALAMLEGYQAARAQRDAYLQEGGR